jgi:Zn-dependent protease/CBS domain-containing protein
VRTTFKLGRIAGIDVGVNWTWLVVFALVTWSLAANVFPDSKPGLSQTTYIVMAAIAAAVFFSCLLMHELGHALQARRDRVAIEGITLWLFGGVARFKGMFPTAGAEFRIALAGPVVSLVIGALLLGVAWLFALPNAVDGVVRWLGYINLLLLAFNLLPALPLDGGRLLRSALWQFKGNFTQATRIAAGLSRVFGQLLIAGGLVVVIFGGAFGGIWIAFIGWFLMLAANNELGQARSRQALSGMHVGDVTIRDPITVDGNLPLRRFVDEVVSNNRFTTYPVTEQGQVVGLVSFRAATALPRSRWDSLTVKDCMVSEADSLVFSEDTDLGEAINELSATDLRRALVFSDGRFIGLFSITDAARTLELKTRP